jgi:hypothetical protein
MRLADLCSSPHQSITTSSVMADQAPEKLNDKEVELGPYAQFPEAGSSHSKLNILLPKPLVFTRS